MRKYISGLLALVLLAFSFSTAEAGWNLRQNDDGTTDWVREGTDTVQDEAPVGAVYLNVLLDNISTAATWAVVSPITDARIALIQHVVAGQITGADTEYDFYILRSITNESQITDPESTEVTNGTDGRLTISACTSSTAVCLVTSPTGVVDTFTPSNGSNRNILHKGSVILIHSDGGSSGVVDGVLTITIVPR